MISYLTDLEGRWDKVESFVDGNPAVSLEGGALRLADGVTFVFGGDAIDRGPHGRRIVELFLRARRDYGERVVLLAGNRDINKLRLRRELTEEPPERTPADVRVGPRGELLRWIMSNTMGAKDAFAHRATELREEGRPADDDSVVQSFLDDLAKGGALRRYLEECRLAFRAGITLFLHGGVTLENLGHVPGHADNIETVDGWVATLNELYRREMATFSSGRPPSELIKYQAPFPRTRHNQASVVYARLADDHHNPLLPPPAILERLKRCGIHRLVIGHTPSGDCPAIVRDGDFEVVLADSSYGRVERGSQVVITDEEVRVRARTTLDDGRVLPVELTTRLSEPEPFLGKRIRETGELVKAKLDDETYLLFRGDPGYRVTQRAASATELAKLTLDLARV